MIEVNERAAGQPATARRRSFWRDTRGGAMTIAMASAILLISGAGAGLSNYAWREAQWEELRNALRAAVSTTGHLLSRITEATAQELMKERIAEVMTGLVPGLTMDADDVTITHDAGTRVTEISVAGNAAYPVSDIWGGSDGVADASTTLPGTSVRVRLTTERHEIAVATDLSGSMRERLGTSGTRFTALQAAMNVAVDLVEESEGANPGSMLMAIVPFSSTVNVADTSGTGDTEGKRRYARMLMGTEPGSTAAAATTGHWVDTFHSYGSGSAPGQVNARTLPDFFSGGTDWDLRATGVDIDVSSHAPSLGTWTVDGIDFWSGCVMARWGAYWNSAARPSDWDQASPGTALWPAAAVPAAWTPASSALTSRPLHLSDVPPDAAHPSTRFVAWSWPDARIGGIADAQLELAMLMTLEPGLRTTMIDRRRRSTRSALGYNDWSLSTPAYLAGGGDKGCIPHPIVPLSADAASLRTAIAGLGVHRGYQRRGQTFLHLGTVWGLRAVSPLWRTTWGTSDEQGVARPLAPCASGETGTHCDDQVEKTLVLVTDGNTTVSTVMHEGRAGVSVNASTNAQMRGGRGERSLCTLIRADGGTGQGTWKGAEAESTAAAFNGHFTTEANGKFGTQTAAVVQALETAVDDTDQAVNHGTWATLIGALTPWQLFRGNGWESTNSVIDKLVDPNNALGLQGRPSHRDPCRVTGLWSPYGRMDDWVNIGGQPFGGVSPFNTTGWPASLTQAQMRARLRTRLTDWFSASCATANERGVRIEAVYIGGSDEAYQRNAQAELEACIDAAGGDPNETDLYVTPTAATLATAFREIFSVNRNLRFLD